jgi:hypothetical protein
MLDGKPGKPPMDITNQMDLLLWIMFGCGMMANELLRALIRWVF